MTLAALKEIINSPAYHDLFAILKGARNGLVLGCKVRFPHALVIAIFFGRGDWLSRLKTILLATRIHATNLAKFVTMYKVLMIMQRELNGGKPRQSDAALAGGIGGYFAFGESNAINQQLVLYVAGRAMLSLLPRAPQPHSNKPTTGLPLPPDPKYFAAFAALSWACGLWIFQHNRETVQSSAFHSMVYLYEDSEKWNNLRTLFWHNK